MTPDLKELTRRLRETPPHVLKEREAAAAIDSLIAELEQCRREAARFRALRDMECALVNPDKLSYYINNYDELDKHIERVSKMSAAIAKEQS